MEKEGIAKDRKTIMRKAKIFKKKKKKKKLGCFWKYVMFSGCMLASLFGYY